MYYLVGKISLLGQIYEIIYVPNFSSLSRFFPHFFLLFFSFHVSIKTMESPSYVKLDFYYFYR